MKQARDKSKFGGPSWHIYDVMEVDVMEVNGEPRKKFKDMYQYLYPLVRDEVWS